MSYWNGAQVYIQPLYCVRLWTRRALCLICTYFLSCWIFRIVLVIWYIIHSRWLELKGKWNIYYIYLISLKINANINISLSPLKWHILLMLIPRPHMGNKWNICLLKRVVLYYFLLTTAHPKSDNFVTCVMYNSAYRKSACKCSKAENSIRLDESTENDFMFYPVDIFEYECSTPTINNWETTEKHISPSTITSMQRNKAWWLQQKSTGLVRLKAFNLEIWHKVTPLGL